MAAGAHAPRIHMIQLSSNTRSLLEAAVIQEISRLKKVAEEVGDDWPSEFDPNDIWLFGIVLDELRSQQALAGQLDLSGKPLVFLLRLVPPYIRQNAGSITEQDYSDLRRVYEAQKAWAREEFPTWSQ